MRKVEYSQSVRNKLKILSKELKINFGAETSKKVISKIINSADDLSIFENKGIKVSEIYDVECEYRYLIVDHSYLFYRIENDKIIIVEMFDNREYFMMKLFGIKTTSQETLDYWNE